MTSGAYRASLAVRRDHPACWPVPHADGLDLRIQSTAHKQKGCPAGSAYTRNSGDSSARNRAPIRTARSCSASRSATLKSRCSICGRSPSGQVGGRYPLIR